MPRARGRVVRTGARNVGHTDISDQYPSNPDDWLRPVKSTSSPIRASSPAAMDERGPRSFPNDVKAACWEKAEIVPGRDPARWRKDVAGNTVFRKLTACEGCLCYEYDHIVPYSKGGPSTLENCQVLQTSANRAKSNNTNFTRTDLIQRSTYCTVKDRDMDSVETYAFGNVRLVDNEKGGGGGGCNIL